ncbi:MAG: DUF2071 domain-containing protein [Archangium sp.]
MIDRLAPTRRPDRSPSGYQNWRELLFVHWSYPVEAVRPLVPPELELDCFEPGRVFVGAVPFVMKDIRLALQPRFTAMNFLETNLRTYVLHKNEPGVFFFSLEASSRLAVRAARWGWGLPYFDAEMTTSTNDGVIDYATTRAKTGASLKVRFKPTEHLGASQPGTLEHFLLERYFLFTKWRDAIWKGHVHHVPYPAQRCELLSLDESLTAAAGLPAHEATPATIHYSAGVDVEVFGPDRV